MLLTGMCLLILAFSFMAVIGYNVGHRDIPAMFITFLIAVILGLFSLLFLLELQRQSYIEVYTNKVVCYLEEQQDQTTRWSCENLENYNAF